MRVCVCVVLSRVPGMKNISMLDSGSELYIIIIIV